MQDLAGKDLAEAGNPLQAALSISAVE